MPMALQTQRIERVKISEANARRMVSNVRLAPRPKKPAVAAAEQDLNIV
jgi:hypothetical protein